jgi:hypothetical protein
MFVNLSNHPSETWSERQKTAAESLGGPIVDEPFPEVPPNAITEEVEALAASTFQRIALSAPAAVLIQGEFTLTLALVRRFQEQGIPCYSATTARAPEFAFVQFRQYPPCNSRA